MVEVMCLQHPVPPPLQTPQAGSSSRPAAGLGAGREQEAAAPLMAPRDARDRAGKVRERCPPGTCVRASQSQLEEKRRVSLPPIEGGGAGRPEPIGAGVVLNWLRSRKWCGGDVVVSAVRAG